jgi:hypothetical protein
MNSFTQKRLSGWGYWILAPATHRGSWWTAWNWYGHSFSRFVARCALVTDKLFRCPQTLLPVGVFMPYSVFHSQDTHSWTLHEEEEMISARMFENKHTFFWWICVHAPAQLVRNRHEKRPSNKDDLDWPSQRRFGQCITQACSWFWCHFCIVVRGCCWVVFQMVQSVFICLQPFFLSGTLTKRTCTN